MRKFSCVSFSLFLLAVTAHEDAQVLLQAEGVGPKKVATKDNVADLQSMKMSQLRKLAKEHGASNDELDAAEDAYVPQDAMIQLIERGPKGPATTLAFGVPSDTILTTAATVSQLDGSQIHLLRAATAADASEGAGSVDCYSQEFVAELQSTVEKLEAEHEKLVEQVSTMRALAKESATAASETLQSTAESDIESAAEASSHSSETDDAAAKSEASTSVVHAESFEAAEAGVEATTHSSDTGDAEAKSDASTSAGDAAKVEFILSSSDQRCENYEKINLGTTIAIDPSTTAECGALCKDTAECVGFAWSRAVADVMHCLLWKGACEMVAETEWDQYIMKAGR